MHPALSVILFTVTSGAGFGLMVLLALFDRFELGGGLTPEQIYTTGIVSLVLTTVGLMASSGHLANKKNAWRAFFRFKTSWLSREAVFAVVYYPFAIGYLGGLWLLGGEHNWFTQCLGIIAAVLAVITIFSTGMIYACLRTIRQWNTALTPANYVALGLMLGSLLLTGVLAWSGADATFAAGLALPIVLVALLMKGSYYYWIGQPSGATINTATGFTRAMVRILDMGHTAGTFLTREFGHELGAGPLRVLRAIVYVLGFILPALALAGYLNDGAAGWVTLAVVSSFIGIAVERWLFFAEARHVVNLYHGAQRT